MFFRVSRSQLLHIIHIYIYIFYLYDILSDRSAARADPACAPFFLSLSVYIQLKSSRRRTVALYK